MLRDHQWKLKYTSDDHTDLVAEFYIPALEDAERYDRLTGYFNARALALAARGIEGDRAGAGARSAGLRPHALFLSPSP